MVIQDNLHTGQELNGQAHKGRDHRHMDQPAQEQDQQPGVEQEMEPRPQYIDPAYKGSEKLKDKVALITGGDSGIGRATAIHFAAEGATVAFTYLTDEEKQDAEKTLALISQYGGKGYAFQADLCEEERCQDLVDTVVEQAGKLDIVVNNAAQQFPKESIEQIDKDQLEKTFQSNVYSAFFVTKAALPYLKEGSRIINTTSITAYKGHAELVDYSATKGAILSFTRSLAMQLSPKKINVNAVAPGPIWTPLIPASFDAEEVENFGKQTPLGRPGQPSEVAPAYVYLASNDSSYVTGQVIHPNGGTVING
jgi:NAD(P)-dependent dehydrogenase (short-subunit alcohol dehydrogenase family)